MEIGNTILLKKYHLSRILGQGRNGTVYLAMHRELEEKRAIKRVPKSSVDYERFKQEALLLKELRHPGIPIVYDLEEDSDFSYLIEEYLEGDSLYDLVKNQGPLKQETVIRYGIQICDLVHYLHIAGEIPILYLDLQPKNLLLCHETIKLIDFDHAATVCQANESSQRFGTPGCCAPEQMDVAQPLDTATDVYAIGSILYFLMTGSYPGMKDEEAARVCGRTFWKILCTCLQNRKEDRYQTAEEVKLALQGIEGHGIKGHGIETGKIGKHRMRVWKQEQTSPLTIALTGSRPGVGTTHLSISLSAYLWQAGYPNLYEEHNRSGAVRRMAAREAASADSYGILKIKHMQLKPWYGQAVRWKEHPYSLVVRDYGTDWDAVCGSREIDRVLLVCGGAYWDAGAEQEGVNCLKECPGFCLVYNHPMPGVKWKKPDGITGKQCFSMPCLADPFQPDGQAGDCLHQLLSGLWCGKEGGSLRSFLRKKAGKICRKIISSV